MTLNRVYVEQVTISSQRLTEREPDTSASLVNLTWMSVDCGQSWSNWRTPPQAQWEPGRSKHKDPSRGACLNPYDLQFLSTIYNLCCQNFSIGLSLLKFFFSPLLSGCSFTNVTTFEQLQSLNAIIFLETSSSSNFLIFYQNASPFHQLFIII